MSNPETQSAESTRSPQQVLMQITRGMWVAQCVATAARLGIADALAQSQPQGSTDVGACRRRRRVGPGTIAPGSGQFGVLAEPSRSSMRSLPLANCSAAMFQAPCATG